MSKFVKSILMGATLAALMLPAVAQTSTDSATPTQPAATKPADVAERKQAQQDRIANGIQNGSLTPGEAAGLEKRESKLNQETQAMRAADGGKLTAADKAKLERQQNRMSHAIYRQKHDGQSVNNAGNPSTPAGRFSRNEQGRIANGVKDGSLTTGEASKLEGQQAKINQERNDMRAADGGKLSAADRSKVSNQEHRLSHETYRAKHNSRHR